MGRYIDIEAGDGGSFKAYVAEPAQGSGPGILLLQEIFGINPYIREMADFYAEEGYVVVAPDLFCLLYTSPSPRDKRQSRMPSSA